MHPVKYKIRSLSVPYPVGFNPHYYKAKEATEDWVTSYGFIDDPEKEASFFASEFSFFVCLVYHEEKDFEIFKAICDFMSFFFIFDDPCEQFSGEITRLQNFVNPILSVISGGAPTEKFSLAFHDFLNRLQLSPTLKKRFLETYKNYIGGILSSSINQFIGKFEEQTLEAYTKYRRDSIGARPCLVLLEKSLRIELPEAALTWEPLISCVDAMIDHVWITNDIVSFNKEVANNEHRGLVEYLRTKEHCDYQTAVDKAIQLANTKLTEFDRHQQRVLDGTLSRYPGVPQFVEGLKYWLSGNLIWELMSYRYASYNHAGKSAREALSR